MISGDRMKKKITVKRKHRYTNERDVLFQGLSDFEKHQDCIKLIYQEKNNEAQVQVAVSAYKDHMEIHRQGETSSILMFEEGKRSKGVLTSPYGDMDIDLYTYRYIWKDTVITLEYDVMQGDAVIGGYRILWSIKEDRHE